MSTLQPSSPTSNKLPPAFRLSVVLVVLTLVQSVVGVFHPQIFRDPALTAGNARGMHLVMMTIETASIAVDQYFGHVHDLSASLDAVSLFAVLTVISLIVTVAICISCTQNSTQIRDWHENSFPR